MRTYLRPYRRLLVAILVLHGIQSILSLTLPTLNAEIIDEGVLVGDTDHIWSLGGLMLGLTVLQIAFAIGAVYFAGRTATAFGRDLRRDLFHRVTDFSVKEVNLFGAPSLITRITNDVQQIQMFVGMVCTMTAA